MAISPDLWKLIYAFGEAADDVGAVYADTIHSKKERDAATKRMVEARAALVAAIEAEVEATAVVKMGMSALERADWARALRYFLDDPQFQVAVGGNPIAVERMLARARSTLEHYSPREP